MTDNTIDNEVTIGDAGKTMLANRYHVIRQLGQGGMGSVWLAEDTQLDNRQVAIKMLPAILVSNKRAYNQLKSEALVSLKLTHPNIATVRAFEENGGNPFLVVDYIDGETLDDYLAEKGKLSEADTICLLTPIAAALDYAHGEGVVHRDVKPGNVIVRRDGRPFILDFGIAREIQETMTRVTGAMSSGTLMYMSPEQLHGAEPAASQDVYSFAAMAYECISGHPPFYRGQIEFQILNDVPALLPETTAFTRRIMQGLAKDHEERPANCAAVLAAGADRTTGTDGMVSVGRASATASLGGVQLWENGPYWAECNIGATKPEESGYYFWWGDTVGYCRVGDCWQSVDGSWLDFTFSEENCPTYGLDISLLKRGGFIDTAGKLVAAHDAATVHLGAPWRMPTEDEFSALAVNCTSKWIQRNGVFGMLVRGKGDFVSKSIFLPAVGLGLRSVLFEPGVLGYCWSSTPNSDDSVSAWHLFIESDSFGSDGYGTRERGRPIRPVRG